MSLTREDFAAFFDEVNGGIGARPFAWQERLLDHVVTHGRWPDQISAPTGSGKSAVVDVHVFATALSAATPGLRLPRRLVVVVNRRALVDAQYSHALAIRDRLRDPQSDTLRAVAAALSTFNPSRSWSETPAEGRREPGVDDAVLVTNLRGGLAPERGWIDDPTTCQVIAATPDMWGSRLLMRGYGSRAQAWPREAGLFAYDAVVVVDEAHLTRQLLQTARRIAELENYAADSVGVPILQVVETTATPTSRGDASVGVEESDLRGDRDPSLVARLTRPKPLSYIASPAWPSKGKATRPHVDAIADAVDEVSDAAEVGVVGCVVNNVDTALQVASVLGARGRRVEVWTGGMRGVDVDALLAAHPEVMAGSQTGVNGLDVLVATQTVEVGVDLDFAGLVTELASGAAIAQRAGRVNRVGRRESGRVVVVGPADEPTTDRLPYVARDLVNAYRWVRSFLETAEGLSPWRVRSQPPPPETPRRQLWQRLEMYDAWRFARTSEHPFEPEELTLYLRDELDPDDVAAGVVLRPLPPDIGRRGGQLDLNEALGLMGEVKPTPEEVYPSRIGTVRRIAEQIVQAGVPAGIYREDGLIPVSEAKLRPGDVLILPDSESWISHGVVVDDSRLAQPVAGSWGSSQVFLRGDVLVGVDGVVEPCRAFAGMEPKESQQEYYDLTGRADLQVSLPTGSGGMVELPWVVVSPRDLALDPETLQETALANPVALHQHEVNVAQRGDDIASAVGLSVELVASIRMAGDLHDEGKRDPRFQRRLGADPHGPVLAKSGTQSAQDARRAARASGLRRGWRHEQLSAAVARSYDADDLVVRLAGTSHGYGRIEFDPPGNELRTSALASGVVAAVELLYGPDAEWHEIIERTEQRWGVWGCAYLEALLRAADCQVSREGS